MGKSRVENDYLDWLISSLNVVEDRDYGSLLDVLYSVKFYSLVAYDEDRAADGVALRDVWADEIGYTGPMKFGECSMLEALIGIAKRVEFQLFGSRWADEWDYVRVFWDFIKNLGLLDFSGRLSPYDCDKIVTVCVTFLSRKYNCDTFGNIFCIFEARKDLRKMNISSQMGLYIRQKWPI